MKNLLLLALVGIVGFGCAVPADMTPVRADSVRGADENIVGGYVADDSQFPAVGALVSSGQIFCTGTLISPTRVVTAAHCVYQMTPQSFAMRRADGSGWTLVPVSRAVPHPSYNSSQLTNDIAYLDLAEAVDFVEPLEVNGTMNSAWEGEKLVHVGFGATQGYGGIDNQKRYVEIPTTDVAGSQFRYSGYGVNTCNGDSGGPALAFNCATGKWVVAGVTSYGDANCTQYGVDTRVDAFRDFIGEAGQVVDPACDPNSQPSPEPEPQPEPEPETEQPETEQPTPTPEQPDAQDPCRGETYFGRCAGSTVVWCENGEVLSKNCSEDRGKVCGYNADKDYMGCGYPN